MQPRLSIAIAGLVVLSLAVAPAAAQNPATGVAGAGTLVVKPLVEKKVTALPAGPLFWRVENFPTIAEAQASAGPTSLVAQSGGKAWLFTLGPAGGSSNKGTKVIEVGPLARISAQQYLLRVNEASGAPGSVTPVHTHPGAEAAYVLAGEQSFRTPQGVERVGAGQFTVGHGPDTPMQVSSSGAVDLHALIMFVVDATRPFSSPATLR
jgi:quercetin dioxygenase-like cupin family protein